MSVVQTKSLTCAVAVLGSLGATASIASAADMPPARAPVLKARPAAGYQAIDWSGFYLGGHGGFGATQLRGTYFDVGNDGTYDFSINGAVAGGQIGYLMQFGRAVYGMEIDGSWANLKGTTINDDGVHQDFKTDFLASARFRSGIAIDNVLLYSTIGVAYATSSFAVHDSNDMADKISLNKWGIVGGLGAEWAFGPNWSMRAEYLYYRFDTFDDDGESLFSKLTSAPRSPTDFLKLDGIHVGRVALNYRFNGAGTANTTNAPVTDWSGLYVGVHGGYLNSRITGAFNGDDQAGAFKPTLEGFAGGGQIGFNVQSGAWVYGLEADASWVKSDKERTDSDNDRQTLKTNVFASARARLGIAADDKLFYLTGGMGYVRSGLEEADAFTTYKTTFDAWGPVIGGGVDWRFAPSWSARLESLTFLGSERTDTTDFAPASNSLDFVRQSTVTVTRVGLNYHFQAQGVAAKY